MHAPSKWEEAGDAPRADTGGGNSCPFRIPIHFSQAAEGQGGGRSEVHLDMNGDVLVQTCPLVNACAFHSFTIPKHNPAGDRRVKALNGSRRVPLALVYGTKDGTEALEVGGGGGSIDNDSVLPARVL